jgi:hypothetical protein
VAAIVMAAAPKKRRRSRLTFSIELSFYWACSQGSADGARQFNLRVLAGIVNSAIVASLSGESRFGFSYIFRPISANLTTAIGGPMRLIRS